MGQLKQFLEHLRTAFSEIPLGRPMYIPIPFTPDHAAGSLEQTIWTVPTHNLLCYTSRTFDLVAVFAIEELLDGV